MNKNIQKNIDYSTIFDSFQYATDYYDFENGTTMQDMVDTIMADKNGKFDRNKAQQLQEMLNANPELKDAKLISQSHKDGSSVIHSTGKKATDDYIQACAYKLPGKDGDVYVAYRGTGDGRWGDNGQGFTQQSTDMQRDAQKYFDYVVEKYGLDKSNGNLYVTGHSKGGNEAQYVMMTSKYNDKIDGCYSIDGQGFSKKAIEYFKKHNKDGKYDELLSKMYSINGENDYVHFLINPIIPEKNTYYIDQPGKDPHDIFSLYKNGKIGWRYDEDGNIINSAPGFLGRMAKELMDDLRKLPEDQQGNCAMAIMNILEAIMSGKSVGMDGAHASVEDYIIFVLSGVPTILLTLSEDLLKECVDFFGNTLSVIFPGVLAGFFISLVRNVTKGLIDLSFDTVLTIYGNIIKVVKSVGKLVVGVAKWAIDSLKKIESYINRAKEWFFKQSSGYKYATANPYIDINTTTMKQYAGQLRSLSSRSKILDGKMNSLYWQLGIEWDTIANLGRLLKAEVILDFAYRLDSCANYLDTTATDFDKVERSLIGNA